MNNLQAHFKRMQEMATRYLMPEQYVDLNGVSSEGHLANTERFVNDIIYMLDGPEQREAEASEDRLVADLRTLVRSLMTDLRVVDHVVTLEEDGRRRTIVASELMS